MDSKHQAFLIGTLAVSILSILMTVWTSILWARLNSSTVRVNNLIIKGDLTTVSNTLRTVEGAKLATVTSSSLYAQEGYGSRISANTSNLGKATANNFVFGTVVDENSYFADNLEVDNMEVETRTTFDRIEQNGQIPNFSPSELVCLSINAPDTTLLKLTADSISATTAVVTGKLTSRDLLADSVNSTEFTSNSLSSERIETTGPFLAGSGSNVELRKISSSANVTFSGTSEIDRLNQIVSNGTVVVNASSLNITGSVNVENEINAGTIEVNTLTASSVSSDNYTSTQNFSFSEITTETLECTGVTSEEANFTEGLNTSTMQSNYTRVGASNIIDRNRVSLNRVEIGDNEIYDNRIVAPQLLFTASELNFSSISNAGASTFEDASFVELFAQNGVTAENLTAGLNTSNFMATTFTANEWNINGSVTAEKYLDVNGAPVMYEGTNGTVINSTQIESNQTMYRNAVGKNEVLCNNE